MGYEVAWVRGNRIQGNFCVAICGHRNVRLTGSRFRLTPIEQLAFLQQLLISDSVLP